MFYRFVPFVISKYYQSNLVKEHQTTEAKLQLVPEWILAAESLTLLVEFDALFTIMTYPFVTNCVAYQVGFWVVWASFVLTYMFILYYTMNIQHRGNCSVNNSCVASNFSAIVPLAGFGLYLVTYKINIFRCTGANLSICVVSHEGSCADSGHHCHSTAAGVSLYVKDTTRQTSSSSSLSIRAVASSL